MSATCRPLMTFFSTLWMKTPLPLYIVFTCSAKRCAVFPINPFSSVAYFNRMVGLRPAWCKIHLTGEYGSYFCLTFWVSHFGSGLISWKTSSTTIVDLSNHSRSAAHVACTSSRLKIPHPPHEMSFLMVDSFRIPQF